MRLNYTPADLRQAVAKLRPGIESLHSITNGPLVVPGHWHPRITWYILPRDIPTFAAEVIDITKRIKDMRCELQAVESHLRRELRILLTLHDLGDITGKSTFPAKFHLACDAADLDHLVALRQARCELDGSTASGAAARVALVELYLKCYEQAAKYGGK